MSVCRRIRRNQMKVEQKSNKIQNPWRAEQIKKYGFDNWLHNYFIPCNGKTSSLTETIRDSIAKILTEK